MAQETEKTVVPVSPRELILGAISISSNALSRLVTKDHKLANITHQIWADINRDRLFVIRDSKRVPGKYSNDIYRLSDRARLTKNPDKYPYLPEFMRAFEHVLVEGITCSAMARLTDKRLSELRNILK